MPKRLAMLHNLSHNDWLELRRRYIGGSDAAAVVGLNPFSSQYSLWADKTGRLPEKQDTEAMRCGRDLEAYVAQRFTEATGKKVRRAPYMYGHDEYGFAAVNLDREIVGEKAFLEAKTTSILNTKRFKGGEYPPTYYAQVMHGLAVTGCERAYLAVLILNQGFHTFTIERDEDEIASLMEQEAAFWRYVEADEPPPVDGSDATMNALIAIYPGSATSSGAIDLFGRDKLIEEYYNQKALRAAAESKMEEIKQNLCLDLGDNDTGLCGAYKVTWKQQNRNTFDVKAFTADHPEIDLSGYYNSTAYKVFNIKEVKA